MERQNKRKQGFAEEVDKVLIEHNIITSQQAVQKRQQRKVRK